MDSLPKLKLSPIAAWRNCVLLTLAGCLLLGLICFVALGNYLPKRLPLFEAAVIQQLAFAAALGVITAGIWLIQRRRGESFRELGWRKPTTPLAITLAIHLGALYLWGSYFGAQHYLPAENVLALHLPRLLLIPVGLFMAFAEELMMRGFFMTELARARVATWIQILASGAFSAVYHAMHNPTLEGYLPSFILFTLHAALYALGRRSLTPTILAHSIYHVFGEPYLLMLAMRAAA